MKKNEKGRLVCEEGTIECIGHRWFACALDVNATQSLETIACFEDDKSGRVGEWNAKAKYCLHGDDFKITEACYKDRSNDILENLFEAKGEMRIKWMPYIQINGTIIGSSTQGVGLDKLKEAICLNYNGDKEVGKAWLVL